MALQRPTNNKWLWIMALVVACALTVGGWWILTQPSTDDSKATTLTLLKSIEVNNLKPNEQGGNSRGGDLCGGTGGIGQIISVEKDTITIQRKNGRTQLIHLTGQITIKTPAGSASQSDLKIGDPVTLVGDPNSDGSFTANTVVVCGGISPKTQSVGTDASSKPGSTEANSVPMSCLPKGREQPAQSRNSDATRPAGFCPAGLYAEAFRRVRS